MWGSSSSSSSSSSRNSMSLSPPLPPTRHDVFLSFRGEDTRDGFTSHLYAALRRRHIETYMDDRLERGEEITRALEKAIEESMIYVIVFSQDYASSRWCLNELTKILDCKRRFRREVIPVFYKVDPSEVRHQKESYAKAFEKHEGRSKDKMRDWKAALTQAAGLSGWDSRAIRSESILVEDIVKDILRKLDISSTSDYEGLIGIHKHIEQIESMLRVDSATVRIIGIWGMGGIGKTTIAYAIYRKLTAQFGFRSFVENVQEKIEMYSRIHRVKTEEDEGIRHIREAYLSGHRLQREKVLLILDNVNEANQLKDLIRGYHSFGPGSRIIVTSRDKQVLNNVADEIYKVEEMNFQDSLQLFSLNAFNQNHPIETYMGLSEKVLNYAKRIPLALKVLGSFLYGRTTEAWESQWQRLQRLPNPEIFNVLKLSYDGLDEEQQDIFLDIACFYRGHEVNTVKRILDGCGFLAAIGMEVLIERCLISILNHKIVMHDLIQDMGQKIVRQQGANDPGKRSRLWNHKDIYQVLRKNKGTDAIQCIFLDICKIEEVRINAETFKVMDNLRLLQFYKSDSYGDSKVYIPTFLEGLPDGLRFLRWDGFPQRSLPLNFCPENLVELNMRDSHLEQLWDGDQDLPNLKRLDLSGSRKLIQIPDLSKSPNIEEIILSHCVKLDVVCSSSFLSKLNCLWLDGCDGLRNLNLPSSILLKSSGLMVVYNCRSLEMFSVSKITEGVLSFGCFRRRLLRCKVGKKKDEGMVNYFDDSFQPIVSANEDPRDNIRLLNLEVLREGSPSSVPSLNELCWLDLSNCESLTSLPVDLCQMKFLRRLCLRGCSNLESFPEIKEKMENLNVLILDQTAIQELPSFLHHLVGLEQLSLHRCQRLEFIPSSIGSLTILCKLDLAYCESLETIPSSIFKLKLRKLDLHGCSMLRTLPEILEPAENIAHLCLTNTAIKELPSSLDNLVGLQTLRLTLCSDLEFLPNSIVYLDFLSNLDCSGCAKLTKIPNEIGRLPSLRELSLQGSGIVNLPESIAHLSSLKSLDLSDCKMLECIPELPQFLKQLLAFDCPSIRTVSSWRFELPSDSKERIFKFHLTNSQELDATAHSNIAADARHRIIQAVYRSVLFCFPGSTVPDWFPYISKGHSVTMGPGSLNRCNDDRLIGFALCVVLGSSEGQSYKYGHFPYRLTFESDDGIMLALQNYDHLRNYFIWKGQPRFNVRDHTFVWKYHLETTSMNYMLSHARNFTFKISQDVGSYCVPASTVKECGICPLYTKEKDDITHAGDYWVHYKVRPRDC